MIVIPMAGLSKRFSNAGYTVPKFALILNKETVLFHVLDSFKNYFLDKEFFFITLYSHSSEKLIKNECKKLGIKNYKIVILEKTTAGQAETVYEGLKKLQVSGQGNMIIFNIDTFRPNFLLPSEFNISEIDGYLETFIGSGKNWSNVVPCSPNENRVCFTSEKKESSNFCCTGLYYWRNISDFKRVYESLYISSNKEFKEHYIAPMYNELIKEKRDIRFTIIQKNQVAFCGTPHEFEILKSKKNFFN